MLLTPRMGAVVASRHPCQTPEDFSNLMWGLSMSPYAMRARKWFLQVIRMGGRRSRVHVDTPICFRWSANSVVQCIISNLYTSSLLISFTTLRSSNNAGRFDSRLVSTPQGISLRVPPNDAIYFTGIPVQMLTERSLLAQVPGFKMVNSIFTSRGFAWIVVMSVYRQFSRPFLGYGFN